MNEFFYAQFCLPFINKRRSVRELLNKYMYFLKPMGKKGNGSILYHIHMSNEPQMIGFVFERIESKRL